MELFGIAYGDTYDLKEKILQTDAEETLVVAKAGLKTKSKKDKIAFLEGLLVKKFTDYLDDKDNVNRLGDYGALEKHIIDGLKASNLLSGIDTDKITCVNTKKTQINKKYAQEIANLTNNEFEKLIDQVKKNARGSMEDPETMGESKEIYQAQIEAIREAKSQRSFGRKFKEFFNGTWLREKRMLDSAVDSIKNNFKKEKAEEEKLLNAVGKDEKLVPDWDVDLDQSLDSSLSSVYDEEIVERDVSKQL